MELVVIIAVFLVVALACLFFVTRRFVRLVVRLALAGCLLLVLFIGGLAWWYNSGPGSKGSQQKEKPTTSTRRGTPR